jgi:hypothetical protein
MRRSIIFLHRYIGIPMSLVFVVWFLSGIVMMYTGDMPTLSESARLRGQGPVELDAIALSPAAASERAGMAGEVTVAVLQSLYGRPAYRLTGVFGQPSTVFADTGEIAGPASLEQGRAEVARFINTPLDRVRHAGTVSQVDQWTLAQARNLPLERFDIDDGRATRAYFSRESGAVELITDRGSRTLAWLGAIPHWFYFTPLRTRQPVWYWTVVWVAGE